MGPKCVMIIAGEASGDHHGAKLVKAIQKKDKGLFFCGIGDQALERAGVKILMRASELAVVGFTEIIAKIPKLVEGLGIAKKLLKALRPDLLILIDFPDFNLRIAKWAKKLGIPVLYYISPQIWAWRKGRVNQIRRRVDHMAVILPFEKEFYQEHGVPVTFVGHPLLDGDNPPAHQTLTADSGDAPLIGLLPGSRDREVSRHVPVMLEAAGKLQKKMAGIRFAISVASSVERQTVEEMIQDHAAGLNLEIMTGPVEKILHRCRVAIVASGTATLETAISGTPMVVIYKISPMSYWIARALIHRVNAISLVNLIAGKALVAELVQKEANPETIAARAWELLENTAQRRQLQIELRQLRNCLGGPGASERVAEIALEMLVAPVGRKNAQLGGY